MKTYNVEIYRALDKLKEDRLVLNQRIRDLIEDIKDKRLTLKKAAVELERLVSEGDEK